MPQSSKPRLQATVLAPLRIVNGQRVQEQTFPARHQTRAAPRFDAPENRR